MPKTLLSIVAYARLRGCSRQAVDKAIKTGRITPVHRDGKALIDVDQAHIDWAAMTDPAQQQRGAKHQFATTQDLASRSARVPRNTKQPARTRERASALSLVDEKTRSERLRVRKQEIELDELEGRIVTRDAVVHALSNKLIAASETLQAIPDRFAALFAAEADAKAIHRILTAEIHMAMASISISPDIKH